LGDDESPATADAYPAPRLQSKEKLDRSGLFAVGELHSGEMMTTTSRFGESVPVLTLADGHQIPTLALGVWQTPEGAQTKDAVRWALELGYRHIDTAQAYGNEESVGEGLRQSGVDRDHVFITTKFYPGSKDPVREIEGSLERLRLEYVDLYLVHWPQGGPTWAWPGMEQAQRRGYTRSIGVSNFDVKELEQVFTVATSAPVANQINVNPFSYRKELIDENLRRSLVTEAYSPLGTGRYLSHPTVRDIAERVGVSPSQILIRWGLQHGFVVLAKSSHRERIAENAGALRFSLSEDQMAELDRLDAGSRRGAALERKWW
jgi:diketogulonate reductase-like aldo/keto reductase